MSIGGGFRGAVFRVRDTFLILSPTPTEGLIIPLFASARHFRKKHVFITAAGPVTNVLLAVAGLAILLSREGDPLSNIVGGGLLLWTLINIVLGIANLAPFKMKTAYGEAYSDGAQILATRRVTDEGIEQLMSRRNLILASLEYAYGDKLRCLSILENEAGPPEGIGRLGAWMTAVLAETGRLDQGVELGRLYLRDEDLGHMDKALLQNNLAYLLFLRNGEADLDEADSLSAMAIDALPMVLAVKGTRAGVLVARGRNEEGVKLLDDRRFRLEPRSHRASIFATRARGLAGLGERNLAIKAFRKAQRLEPANRCLPLAEAAIGALPAT
jgi:hypothetical protein